jgi:hypothetical protein
MADSEFRNWSGARDLNPGPHGAESHDSPSKHVGFCVFQFDSSSRRAPSVQICTNLQPDYCMKYYRMQVVQTVTSNSPYSRDQSCQRTRNQARRPRMSGSRIAFCGCTDPAQFDFTYIRIARPSIRARSNSIERSRTYARANCEQAPRRLIGYSRRQGRRRGLIGRSALRAGDLGL